MESGVAGEDMVPATRHVEEEFVPELALATAQHPAMAATTVKVRDHKVKAVTHTRAALEMQDRAAHVPWRHTTVPHVES